MFDPATHFSNPAHPKTETWRTILGAVLIAAIYLLGGLAMFLGADWIVTEHAIMRQAAETGLGRTPFALFLLFASFTPAFIGIALVTRFLHKRPLRSLLGGDHIAKFRPFCQGIGVATGVFILALCVTFIQWLILPETVVIWRSELRFTEWVLFLIPMFGAIFIQISAEELLFRGYLLQQLHARFGKFWIAAIVPSVIFGLAHFDHVTYGLNAWLYVMATAVGGIILCSVTLRTGNIGAALGLHFANNVWATLTLGVFGQMDGMSLYLIEIDPRGSEMAVSFISQTVIMVVFYLIWRRYMHKRLG